MRKLIINNQVWTYKIGPSHIKIVGPNVSACGGANEINDTTPSMYERGQYKKTVDGMIGPGMVRAYIESKLMR